MAFYYRLSDEKLDPSDEFNRNIILYTGALWTIVLGFRICFMLQLSEAFGTMVILIYRMIVRSAIFAVFLTIVIFIFAAFFYIVHYKSFTWTQDYGGSLLYMFNSMLGNYDLESYDSMTIASTTVYIIYLALVFIIMLNLLIAILSDTYSKVYTQA